MLQKPGCTDMKNYSEMECLACLEKNYVNYHMISMRQCLVKKREKNKANDRIIKKSRKQNHRKNWTYLHQNL